MTLLLRLLAVAVLAGLGLPFSGTVMNFFNPAPVRVTVARPAPQPLAVHNASFRYDGVAVPAWSAAEVRRQAEIDSRLRLQFGAFLNSAVVEMTPPPAPAPPPQPAPAPIQVAATVQRPVPPPAAAVPAPAPPAPAYSGSVPDLIRSVFAPAGQSAVDWGLRIAKCESNFNPNAQNPYSGAAGVFQFLPSTWRGTPYAASSVFDADANVRAALWLYQRSGPGQWSCT